ncbi:TadE/TadG family type IV pilus assembly protein [Nitrosomonas halophila]|uniref:TadE-like protein n=1 Tax=Nitrosomonas halophila TaxID=44576 RepID=A0A1H3P4B0_9PROT|nr:TadE/TadG family type IV pilus assembly protein [Nitrosomonas halophila]SDY95908.1 TadE-like protein [Nitrosomonas halophila]
MYRSTFRLRQRMQGAVAVEMALLLVPMLVLVFGVAEFGRALYQYNTLAKSVRTAVRHLSQYNPSDATRYTQAQNEARCLAVHGNLICNGPALAPGLITNMVKINDTPIVVTTSEGTTISVVEVGIEGYEFDFFLDPRAFLGGGEQSIRFGDIRASMRQS